MLDERQPAPEKKREIAEVMVLAVVAIATSWSGYQATKWGGEQGRLYALGSSDRFQAEAASTFGGQQVVADSSIFTAWLQARDRGDTNLESLLVRRFSPDYAAAFNDWLKLDPFTNPAAPAGPAVMPDFSNPSFEKATQLNAAAAVEVGLGTAARETANKYVRGTVLFASVLFLVAAGRRFTSRGVRIAADALGIGLLAYTLSFLAILPRM